MSLAVQPAVGSAQQAEGLIGHAGPRQASPVVGIVHEWLGSRGVSAFVGRLPARCDWPVLGDVEHRRRDVVANGQHVHLEGEGLRNAPEVNRFPVTLGSCRSG